MDDDRKPFLLRLSPSVHEAMRKWAEDEMRSLNGHIEFVLREALKRAGRLGDGDGVGGSRTRRPR